MEKAILKTLIYADIFDYPLTIREIHKWLIGKSAEPRRIEKTLKKLHQKQKVISDGEYYLLPGRQKIVRIRRRQEKQSYIYIRKVKMLAQILKLIPWVKLVGVSGGLAMDNTGKADDIDLFIITAKDRLWISRLFILGLLNLTGQRRKSHYTKLEAAGKICSNTILEEDKLVQKKNLYLAHEVLQMRVLWQRKGIYSKYLSDNEWAFKYLPNWMAARGPVNLRGYKPGLSIQFQSRFGSWLLDTLENLARDFQLKLMTKPKGMERVLPGAVYFHPFDYQEKVLREFKKRLTKQSKSA